MVLKCFKLEIYTSIALLTGLQAVAILAKNLCREHSYTNKNCYGKMVKQTTSR